MLERVTHIPGEAVVTVFIDVTLEFDVTLLTVLEFDVTSRVVAVLTSVGILVLSVTLVVTLMSGNRCYSTPCHKQQTHFSQLLNILEKIRTISLNEGIHIKYRSRL